MIKQLTLAMAVLVSVATGAQARVYATTFRLDYPAARAVYVVGSFNNWETGQAGLMKRQGRIWSKTLNLEEGVYLYKFRVQGETELEDSGWMGDPGNPLKSPNQYGTYNSLRVVPAGRSAAQVMNRARQDISEFSRTFLAILATGDTARARVLYDSMGVILGPTMAQFDKQWNVHTQARIDAEKLSPNLSQRAISGAHDAAGSIARMDGALNYFLATNALNSAKEAVLYGGYEIVPYIMWMHENSQKTAQIRPAVPEVSMMLGPEPPAFDSMSISGERVSLAQLKGHVVLIDFWATWCGPCMGEMPHVKELYAEFEPRGLRIIGVSLDKNEAELRRYVHENGIAWPQLFDGKVWHSDLVVAYGVQGIPSTFLLDRNGRLAARDLRGDALKKKVAELLQ